MEGYLCDSIITMWVIESVYIILDSLELNQTTAHLLQFGSGYETIFQNINYCETIV